MTIEEYLIQDRGLSQDVVRTFMMPGPGGACGLGPDVLSAYCPYGFAELHCLDDTAETGWQAFPYGNAGIARRLVKTLIPDSIPGPKPLEAISRNNLNFSVLDTPGQPARIRLGATVVRVEHEHSGQPEKSSFVWVTYTRDDKVYRLKARSVVMAGGCGSTARGARFALKPRRRVPPVLPLALHDCERSGPQLAVPFPRDRSAVRFSVSKGQRGRPREPVDSMLDLSRVAGSAKLER